MPQDYDCKIPSSSLTFLFDIGRVLLDFDFESSLGRLLPANVHDPKERLKRIIARKDEFEAGLISAEEFTIWALEILGSPASASQFRQAWRDIFTANVPMWQCVRKLAANNHRLLLISNTNAIHCPWIFETYPEFSYFEGAILSFEIGYIKPHPNIYHHAINTCLLEPTSTFYIDDMPQNIAIGADLGFHCWQYDMQAHQNFERWLEKILTEQKIFSSTNLI